ncbi:MAG: TIGR01777 family protein [Actinomycetales bacterium]|nr:TIGR01777 family protein [Actinomycetales bacterium]
MSSSRQRIAITGASGLIGGALSRVLAARGDDVIRLVRHQPTNPQQRQWDPQQRSLPVEAVVDVDAIVHLAGAGVGDRRWTPAYKDLVLRSRLDGTTAVAEAIAGVGRPIRLVSASAVGYYGSRGDEILTETSAGGDGFLADVVRVWEGATEAAVAAGAPVALARTGLVMSPTGGAFERLLRLARLGLGGPLGSGRQWWPWITLADEVAALVHLIDHRDVVGPVNLVSPDPCPQREIATAIGKNLGRPAILPAPAFALRVAVGEFADDILASQRVLPNRLTEQGFRFRHATLSDGVGYLLDASGPVTP